MPAHLVRGHVRSDKAAVVLAIQHRRTASTYSSASLTCRFTAKNAQTGVSPVAILHCFAPTCLLLGEISARSTTNRNSVPRLPIRRFGPPCCSCLSLPARWAIVRWRITGMWAHLFFSCVLIWLTSSASFGLVRGENRFTRLPSRSIRNFSKFQLTLPFPAGLASLLVKYL